MTQTVSASSVSTTEWLLGWVALDSDRYSLPFLFGVSSSSSSCIVNDNRLLTSSFLLLFSSTAILRSLDDSGHRRHLCQESLQSTRRQESSHSTVNHYTTRLPTASSDTKIRLFFVGITQVWKSESSPFILILSYFWRNSKVKPTVTHQDHHQRWQSPACRVTLEPLMAP